MGTRPESAGGRYLMIDALRGLACLAVVFFHAKEGGHINALVLAAPAWFGQLLAHGDSGVAIFFVISGFVMANSVLSHEVTAGYVGRFLARRSLRLDPPFWAAIALALLSAYVSAKFMPNRLFEMPSALNLAAHVTYLADLLKQPLVNPAFWTLCIEIQFYLSFVLLMWLVTPLGRYMGRKRATDLVVWTCALVAALWVTSWAPFRVHGLFLDHWYLFMVGVLVWRAVDSKRTRETVAAVCNIALLAALLVIFSGKSQDMIGLTVALMIIVGGYTGWLKTVGGGALLQWLGLISYSLYLTHNTVTGAAFNVAYRLLGREPLVEAACLLLVASACCVFAWMFFLAFEKPGLRWSKLVPLRRTHPKVPASGALTEPRVSITLK